jgi:hypothetical protein
MTFISQIDLPSAPPVSPLLISDRLLTLAQQADDAGYSKAARRLLRLAINVLDEPPRE